MPPDNPAELARKILEVTCDRERMHRMSARNRQRAAQFREEFLRPRRLAFYRHIADATTRWTGNSNVDSY